MNVLLVGGYRPLLETLARALREEGHQAVLGGPVGTASGGAACDVVILDLGRRGQADDLSLLRDLRRDDGAKPRILVLASPDHVNGIPDLTHADACLAKPFGLEQLFRCLGELAPPT
jgi:DNA-binding response OmpR family regulator